MNKPQTGPHEKNFDLVVGELSAKKRILDGIHIIHRNYAKSLELEHITALRSVRSLVTIRAMKIRKKGLNLSYWKNIIN